MSRRDRAIFGLDRRLRGHWIIKVAVLYGTIAQAAIEVVPPEKHCQAAQTALAKCETNLNQTA